jgi:hypothetical protein
MSSPDKPNGLFPAINDKKENNKGKRKLQSRNPSDPTLPLQHRVEFPRVYDEEHRVLKGSVSMTDFRLLDSPNKFKRVNNISPAKIRLQDERASKNTIAKETYTILDKIRFVTGASSMLAQYYTEGTKILVIGTSTK